MMASLNLVGGSFNEKSVVGSDGTTYEFNKFPPLYRELAKINKAFAILDRLAEKEPPTGTCNTYFKSLASGSSFRTLWQRDETLVSYSSSTQVDLYAFSLRGAKDISLTQWCCSTQNHWMVAATLCHELAHLGGAPGGNSHKAEKALKKCYFKDQYKKDLVGSIDSLYRYIRKTDEAPV